MAAHLNKAVGPRSFAALLLVLAVVVTHLAVAEFLAAQAAAFDLSEAMPPRLQAAYVREMAFTAPAPTRPPPRPPRARRAPPVAEAPQAAASRAGPEPETAPVQQAAASAPEPAASPAEAAAATTTESTAMASAALDSTAAAAADTPASAASAATFEWPVSTRLRYLLTGHVRGEVHGQAQVEWIRMGNRYQVHLDVEVGPSFAPLASRRMSSDGEITPDGLAPRRYDQETRLAFDRPYRATVHFEHDRIVMGNGQALPRWPGAQDTASQFVQLSYWFDSRPERLRAGEVVEIPLAMPRSLSVWVYDVLQQETLHTPFGEVLAYHLKPRRVARAGGDLVTEIWIAPQLRHLPVRFRIHQDGENFVDLMLDRRPELAATEDASRNPSATRPP
jgi:hypothetical protein